MFCKGSAARETRAAHWGTRITNVLVPFPSEVRVGVAMYLEFCLSRLQTCQVAMSPLVQVFGCRREGPIHPLRRPASEKRQGTKSRWVGHWLAATAMGICRWRRGRSWEGRYHYAPWICAGLGGGKNALGVSVGVRSELTGARRADGCDWVERDRRRRGASAMRRASRDADGRCGS